MQPAPQIAEALSRTRSRWIKACVVDIGGRRAVWPAAVAAVAGFVLWLALDASWAWLVLSAALGCAGVAAALMYEARKRRRADALATALLLDQAALLHDGLPAYLESRGTFRPALEKQLESALQPGIERLAVPRIGLMPLTLALLLAFTPLVFWPTGEAEPDPPQVAQDDPEDDIASPAGGSSGSNGGPALPEEAGESEGSGGEGESESSDSGNGASESGEPGHVPAQPQDAPQRGAGELPENAAPETSPPNASPTDETGTEPPDEIQPPPPPPEVEDDVHRVKPRAGEGETTSVDRSRWVYNPDGAPREGTTPRPPELEHGGERPIARTSLTSRERRAIEELYRRLFE